VLILDRHFLIQFLKPFLACLVSFLVCMLVYDLFDNISDFTKSKAPFAALTEYYLILIPAWIVDIMPMTMLLSLLYTLSDMSKHGELVAMRASGLDFFRLMRPYFFLGMGISLLMLIINLGWAPNALDRAQMIFDEHTRPDDHRRGQVRGLQYHHIAKNRFWVIDSLDPDENWARGIEITVHDKQLKDTKRISALIGNFEAGRWVFRNVLVYDYTVPTSDPQALTKHPFLITDFEETPAQLTVEAKKTKRVSTSDLIEKLKISDRLPPKQLAKFSTEFHSRIAFPLASFIVLLIGVPFGVVPQRSSNFIAIVNALLFFCAYLFASRIFLSFGEIGRIPPWLAAWLPNILFASAGAWLTSRIR
jgi:lipopolysaccharide export system permease protein